MTHTHLPTKLSQAKKKREGIEYILAHKRKEFLSKKVVLLLVIEEKKNKK